MSIDLAAALSLLLIIGYFAQWLAWHIRIPAILPLLFAGIVLGPVTGWLNPDAMMGKWLFPGISLAVAIILFEGSLTLRFSDLRDVGKAVRGLVSYGAVATLLLLAVAVHWIAGINWELAFLFGAICCVTGPTVITPLLRTLRPNARIARVLRWEGIVIDPLGALFAVLVFEAIVTHQQGHTIGIFLLTVFIGIVIGLAIAALLGLALFKELIPEYLQTYATLVAVLGAFSLANSFADESGLLAVTIMGIVLGNLPRINIEEIMDFKEHLSTLLVSILFVILAARLQWPLAPGLLVGGVGVFLVAQFVIRPVSAWLATAGSELNWREKTLISYVCPRGVVAASVSSLFALKLTAAGMQEAHQLVPLVFILIIGTVVLQSVTARPLARFLKVADPDPDGVLIFGSDRVAISVGLALKQQDFHVLMADDDWDGIRTARMAGLATYYGNPTSEHAETHIDLTGIGRLLAMSTRRDLNSLACIQYRQVFGRDRVYRLHVVAPEEGQERMLFADRLQSKALFEDDMTHARFTEMLIAGWQVKATRLSETYNWARYLAENDDRSTFLFGINAAGQLRVANNKRNVEPKAGWIVLSLAPPSAPETTEPGQAGPQAKADPEPATS